MQNPASTLAQPPRATSALGHSPAVERKGLFYGLEGMRGVAALAVVAWHAPELFGGRLGSSYLAVDLFFVLSGFVIAHAYDPRLAAGMSPWTFMRLRLTRLYPLYLVSLLIALGGLVLVRMTGEPLVWSKAKLALAFGLNSLFLPAGGGYGEVFPLNIAAWSLFFELIANLAYAISWRWLSTRVLVAVAGLAACGLVASAAAYGSLSVGWAWANLPGGLARVFYSFPVGVLIYRLGLHRRALALPAWLPLLALTLLLAVTPGNWRPAYDLVVALAAWPLLVGLAVRTEPGKALAAAFAALGTASYGVYVLHAPLLELSHAIFDHALGLRLAAAAPASGAVFAAALLAIVWSLDRLYDQPLRRRLMRLWPARPRAA